MRDLLMKHTRTKKPIENCKACRSLYLGHTTMGSVRAIYSILDYHYEELEQALIQEINEEQEDT